MGNQNSTVLDETPATQDTDTRFCSSCHHHLPLYLFHHWRPTIWCRHWAVTCKDCFDEYVKGAIAQAMGSGSGIQCMSCDQIFTSNDLDVFASADEAQLWVELIDGNLLCPQSTIWLCGITVIRTLIFGTIRSSTGSPPRVSAKCLIVGVDKILTRWYLKSVTTQPVYIVGRTVILPRRLWNSRTVNSTLGSQWWKGFVLTIGSWRYAEDCWE